MRKEKMKEPNLIFFINKNASIMPPSNYRNHMLRLMFDKENYLRCVISSWHSIFIQSPTKINIANFELAEQLCVHIVGLRLKRSNFSKIYFANFKLRWSHLKILCGKHKILLVLSTRITYIIKKIVKKCP